MDKKAARLRKVVALAEIEEQQECIELKKVQQTLDHAVDRLEQLTLHRRKYQSKPTLNGNVSAARWQDYQRFLDRLNQAVDSQSQLVNSNERMLDAHRRKWQEKHKRVGLLEEIVQRYLKAEESRDERSMQKALDDMQPTVKSFGK